MGMEGVSAKGESERVGEEGSVKGVRVKGEEGGE